jgi:transposase
VLLCVSKSPCRLRQWGLRLKKLKGTKRAAIAVARKLAVIMHRMWLTGRDFDASPVQ